MMPGRNSGDCPYAGRLNAVSGGPELQEGGSSAVPGGEGSDGTAELSAYQDQVDELLCPLECGSKVLG